MHWLSRDVKKSSRCGFVRSLIVDIATSPDVGGQRCGRRLSQVMLAECLIFCCVRADFAPMESANRSHGLPMPATTGRTDMGLVIRFFSDLACLRGFGNCGNPRSLRYLIILSRPKCTVKPVVFNLIGYILILIISIIIIIHVIHDHRAL